MAKAPEVLIVKRVDVEVDSLRIVKNGLDFPTFEVDGKPVSKLQAFTLSWDVKEFPIMRLVTRQVLLPPQVRKFPLTPPP